MAKDQTHRPTGRRFTLVVSEDELARAVHSALREDSDDAHVDSWGIDDRLIVDGMFDLKNVARLVISTLTARETLPTLPV